MIEEKMGKPVVVDFFCGAGGLSYGLQSAGLKIAVGVDIDASCQYALEANTGAKFVCADVSQVKSKDVQSWFGGASVRVMAGCAPCQPFSTYSQGRKTKDERWNLLEEFQRLALEVLPEIITVENVVGLAKQAVWEKFVTALRRENYYVSWRVVDCEKFGVPQTRKRLVLVASRIGDIALPDPQSFEVISVKDAIAGLPKIDAGSRNSEDIMHSAASLSDLNLMRIKHSKPGGTWRDWPEDLRADCHRKDSGKTYPSVYGRMDWSKPAPTMTTQCYGFGNGRFGHPEQDRAISLREAAIIQSFPTTYKFIPEGGSISFVHLGRLIGNAVPPKLGEAIGGCILDHLNGKTNVGQTSLPFI
ncbi:DNA cytosine methyltransferase [Thalassospira sp. A3_1]|uniref:DNA cytosine methyltransferase n=1 Tax=Thalassospira sp. A3_1 TaxID=2821088 RepID=UPI001FFE2337|nr:DNA cytosine methyltransferase [Thalassospira sp. A3_1]